MSNTLNVRDIINWSLGILFFAIGILNLFLVHPFPGIFYLLFSFIYYPPIDILLKQKLGFLIPFAVKIVLALLIIWVTLAVGDLAEMFGL